LRGATVGALVDLGAAVNIEFNEDYDLIMLVPDNAPPIPQGRKNHRAVVKFDLLEVNMDNVASLRGGADTKTPVAASPVTVTDERHVLTGVTGCRFDYKQGAGTICTAITVKNAAGTSAVLNTDYVLYLDAAGYTCIARVSASVTIPTGDNVKVTYTYTPNASITFSSGGLQTLTTQIIRLTNTNTAGKKYAITLYKALNQKGLSFKLPADDTDKPWTASFELRSDIDSTRTAGDQLFSISDEQGV
jgi:hypothetical protein